VPELDAPLAERLERRVDEETLAMIARYATAAPLARVRAIYERRTEWGASSSGLFLGYFLRVDPPFGASAARALYAAAARDVGRALSTAAEQTMTPELEALLIDALSAPSADTLAAAARALSAHGSRAAEAALWLRLERFHAEWQGRPDDLRYSFRDPNRGRDAAHIESALAYAIATASAWLCDEAAYLRLQSLVVGAHMKEQMGHGAAGIARRVRLEVSHTESGEVRAKVAQYDLSSVEALEAKLAQFPRGTAFLWHSWDEGPGDFEGVHRALEALGMTLAR
jgi:hypothetical protein